MTYEYYLELTNNDVAIPGWALGVTKRWLLTSQTASMNCDQVRAAFNALSDAQKLALPSITVPAKPDGGTDWASKDCGGAAAPTWNLPLAPDITPGSSYEWIIPYSAATAASGQTIISLTIASHIFLTAVTEIVGGVKRLKIAGTPPSNLSTDTAVIVSATQTDGQQTAATGTVHLAALAPGWIGGFRYSYDTNNLLSFEAYGNVGKLKFERQDGSSFTTTNPDAVPISSGQFYDHGDLVGQAPFVWKWQLYYTGGAIRVTAQQKDATATYVYSFTPIMGATHVVLSGSSDSTPPEGNNTETNEVSANLPPWETFEYQPITTNQSWTDYDTRKYNGVDEIGDKIVLDNGQVRAELWKNWGGSVCHISVSGTEVNMINQNKDKGRGCDITWYRGGRTRQIESENKAIWTSWATPEGGGVGNDPISIGDVFGNPSIVVAVGRSVDGSMAYVKCRMMNWAVENDPTDMYREYWVSLSGKEVRIRSRLTANRTMDKTPYEARSQEYPNFYVNYPWRTAAFVGGDGNLQYLSDGNRVPFSIKEPFVAMVNGTSPGATGIGLHRSGMYRINQETQGGDGSGEFDARAGYTNAEQHIQSDWNGVYYGDHSFYVGSVSEIRSWANAKPNPRNKLSWKFNARNGRGWFWYHNCHDTGFPTPNEGVQITSEVDGYHEINWPDVSIPASSITNLYMRYKAEPGYSTLCRIIVGQPGESPTTEAAHYKDFTISCDNNWHTVRIPAAEVPGYGGTISRVRMANFGANRTAKLTIAWINTSDADPEA